MGEPQERSLRITLRVNILTIFLTLLLSSFATVLIFLDLKNREIVEGLSQELMGFVRKEINHHLDDLLTSTELIVSTFPSLYTSSNEITPDNEQLRAYMLSEVKNYPNVAFFYVGTEVGDSFRAEDLSFSNQTHYISKPDVPLPEKAIYRWQALILSKEEPYEVNDYLDQDFQLLSSEKFPLLHFDVRMRPWYIGAKEAKGLYWSDVYSFFEVNGLGITVSEPLYDLSGKFFGVVGVDLSFDFLSKFFASQKIGKSGKPFILDREGKLIIPSNQPKYFSSISPDVVAKAFQTYQAKREGEFEFRYGKTPYLGNIEPFPAKNGENWLVAIIVPHADFFAKLELTQKSAILIILLISGLTGLGVIISASRLSRPIVFLAREVDKVRQLDFSKEERVRSRIKEIYLMDQAISLLRSAVQSFTRYVPKEIVRGLFSQNKEIKLGGEKREVTVFFSDIEGFTSITEEQPTDQLMDLLAQYFDGMSKIILASQGTIDKYIGDSIMAFWGAPEPLPQHTAACAETALSCHLFVEQFNQRCKEKKLPLFKTRFGINAGVAIAGNIGTPERMNYTLIGDMVNAASRIQNINKIYGTTILIGEAAKRQLDERFLIRPIDVVEVKGKKEKIPLYELVAMTGGPKELLPTPEEIELCERFTKAYEAFQEERGEAKKLFEALHRDFPDDKPTQIYLYRS